MCPSKNLTPVIGSTDVRLSTLSGVYSALQYTPPVYRETNGCSFIEFYAYDPDRGKMRRKRMKINRIKGVVKRRQYAREVIKRLCDQFNNGWNPWIAKDVSNLYVFDEALSRYEAHVEKMLANGYFRKETYNGYKSYIKILREYIRRKKPLHYVYQFDRKYCVAFLDYVFVDRNNGAQMENPSQNAPCGQG